MSLRGRTKHVKALSVCTLKRAFCLLMTVIQWIYGQQLAYYPLQLPQSGLVTARRSGVGLDPMIGIRATGIYMTLCNALVGTTNYWVERVLDDWH